MADYGNFFEYPAFYKADFFQKRSTITIKVNCCVFDHSLFKIAKAIGSICILWHAILASSHHLRQLKKKILGHPTYVPMVQLGNQKKTSHSPHFSHSPPPSDQSTTLNMMMTKLQLKSTSTFNKK